MTEEMQKIHDAIIKTAEMVKDREQSHGVRAALASHLFNLKRQFEHLVNLNC